MKLEELILAKCINDVDPWNDGKTSLEVGRYYLPERINIGQSCSDVVIDGKSYNSILFDFYDSRLEEIDIYHSKYSPYFREEDKEIEDIDKEMSKLQSEIDLLSNEIGSYHNKIHSMRDRNNYMKETLKDLRKAVNELKKGK